MAAKKKAAKKTAAKSKTTTKSLRGGAPKNARLPKKKARARKIAKPKE